MQRTIVTIAWLWEGRQSIPLLKLAEAFVLSPVSVNEMCRRLQDNRLVNYQPQGGASLAHSPCIDDQKETSEVKAIAEQQISSNQSAVKSMALDRLQVGQHGGAVRVAACGQIRQRPIDMGQAPGSEIYE